MSTSSVCLVVFLLALTAPLAHSAVIIVGGPTGWTTGFDYDAWSLAQNIQPRVGDSLVFVNPDSLTHTVAMLSSLDAYQRCVVGGASNITPISPGTNFTLVIPAALQGMTVYAVCTIPGHCTDNQKIKGTILPALTTGSPGSPSPPGAPTVTPPTPSAPGTTPNNNDADMNRIICWTTAILLIVACFWNVG